MMAALAATAMTLGELLGAGAGPHHEMRVTDLVIDSRQVTPGAAFIAVRGHRSHGLAHAEDALARGAAIVLYEPTRDGLLPAPPQPSVAVPDLSQRLGALARAFYARDAALPRLAGVTGTNGKSTVAYLVAQAMTSPALGAPAATASASRSAGSPRSAAHVDTGAASRPHDYGVQGVGGQASTPAAIARCGYIGTLGYGVPPVLATHSLTTPDCFTLHRELRALDVPRAALEVSSHALAQDRIAGLRFEIAAFTNLTRDHLDHHGDMQAYGRAKARLFELPGLAHAVLNVDDAYASALIERMSDETRLIRVSSRDAPSADLTGRLARADLAGLAMEIDGRLGAGRLRSSLIGDFNAENLLLALGVLLAWDVPMAEACERLEACEPPPGRMERVPGPESAPHVIVDYAHTPAALQRVLGSLRRLANGELWCVFGCGGDRDAGKRPLMGKVAAELAQHVVLTDDNPRSEDPRRIVEEIRAGMGAHADVVVEHDRRRAITTAIQRAAAGDVVLVAGKGHERVQIRGEVERPFSDTETARAALEGRS